MEVRGERECTECGTRWSYYETGSVNCPQCGSIRSVGVGDREHHTDAPVSLDLTDVQATAASEPVWRAAEDASEVVREYVRRRGFVHAGDLRPLDDTYLAAQELRVVADVVANALEVDDPEELYFLQLLRGAADGERPDPDDVPPSLRDARGLAYSTAVREYRRELATWLDDHEDPTAREVHERLGDHVRRVRALEGDVSPADAERLVRATRELATYLVDGDELAIEQAREHLARLA